MSLTPEQNPAMLASAQEALKEGRPGDAVEIAKRVTAEDSSNYDAWQLLGAALAQQGRVEEAVSAFSACVRQRPNIPQPHFNLARALFAAGNQAKAREELELCLQLDATYTNAAQMLRQMGPAPQAKGFGVPGVAQNSEPEEMGLMVGKTPPPPPSPMGQAAAYGASGAGQGPTMVRPGGYAPAGPGGPGMAPGQAPYPGAPAGFVPPQQFRSAPMLEGATKGWAISAIVLSVLHALSSLNQLVQSSANDSKLAAMGVHMPSWMPLLSILDLLIALCFLMGGIGVLQQRDWGRKTMIGAAIAAIIATILASLAAVFVTGPIVSALGNRMVTRMPAGAPQMGQMVGSITNVIVGVTLLICLAYCIPLMLHMKSERAANAMTG